MVLQGGILCAFGWVETCIDSPAVNALTQAKNKREPLGKWAAFEFQIMANLNKTCTRCGDDIVQCINCDKELCISCDPVHSPTLDDDGELIPEGSRGDYGNLCEACDVVQTARFQDKEAQENLNDDALAEYLQEHGITVHSWVGSAISKSMYFKLRTADGHHYTLRVSDHGLKNTSSDPDLDHRVATDGWNDESVWEEIVDECKQYERNWSSGETVKD